MPIDDIRSAVLATQVRLSETYRCIRQYVRGHLNETDLQRWSGVRCAPDMATGQQAFARLAQLIFAAGLPPYVVAPRWRCLSAILDGPDWHKTAALTHGDVRNLLAHAGMLHHPRKILAIVENARILQRLVAAYGSLKALCDWLRSREPADALAFVSAQLDRVGPVTASRWLQSLGVDIPVPHPAVRRWLRRVGVLAATRKVLDAQLTITRTLAVLESPPCPLATASATMYLFATGSRLPHAFCTNTPDCCHCPAGRHCHHGQTRNRTADVI